MKFEGQGKGSSNGTAFVLIDAVALDSATIPNAGFENPTLSHAPRYQYNPSGAGWSFAGTAGITTNGSAITLENPPAPEGVQTAFVEDQGVVSQVISVSGGTYSLTFQAAQSKTANDYDEHVEVTLRNPINGVSIKKFVWCGNTICEERDASGTTVVKRFFAEGEQRIKGDTITNLYYTRDHLGSIREIVDSNGVVRGQYDYDPYGNRVVVSGQMDTDIGYTGHYYHAKSGLNLTLYRAYNPKLGRWMSRDPIGEAGGSNLYAYVENHPTNTFDPLGLDFQHDIRFPPLGPQGVYNSDQNCSGYSIGIWEVLPLGVPYYEQKGCKEIPCSSTCDSCTHKVLRLSADEADSGHAYRLHPGGKTWSCKYGAENYGIGTNPVADYFEMYYNVWDDKNNKWKGNGKIRTKCFCCPGK